MWRDPDGNILAQLPLNDEGGEFGGTFQLGQARVNALVMEEIKKYPYVEVIFGVPYVGIEDLLGAESVKVMVHQRGIDDGDIMFEADCVLGTDGRNSSVWRTMCIPFEGVTSDFKMITADICSDFAKEMGYTPLNFFVYPNEWGVVAYTGQNGDGTEKGADVPQWRLAFVEQTGLPTSKEEISC